MATVALQRDLVIALKKETLLNVGTLSKVHPMPVDLSRLIFTENALEKLTQNVFNHLSHYLVSIFDRAASSRLPWPLYDSKTERTYRNELSSIIAEYSSKGLLSPVMSSYLVNPGCYKVTFLIFQLSQLAVQLKLLSKMNNSQKSLYDEMTEKYKSSQDDGFIEGVEIETKIMSSKFANYLRKKEMLEKMAETLRNQIVRMEKTYLSLEIEEYLINLVENYINKHNLDCVTKKEILKIKTVNEQSQFFDAWLEHLDIEIDKLESSWDCKMTPMLEAGKKSQENTEELIARHTGEVERKTFAVEYNPKTDEIYTSTLQDQVNSQQKYVLKNIIRDDKLHFPNLIRGCLISMCFVLRDIEIGDEIYRFNEYLEEGRRNYNEIISTMKMLLERVMKAEKRIEYTPSSFNQSISSRVSEIPPLPDLSDLKMNRDYHEQVVFDTFTPWNANKHQFNLRRKRTIVNSSFLKPAPRSLLVTPFHRQQRDDLTKSIISCRISAYDSQNPIHMHNLSMISQITHRGNETTMECSSGFTKQQINRLLSTKKSSSTKKHKFKTDRPLMSVKKGGLFNESTFFNDSIVLTRSQSSPNLIENRDKRSQFMARDRKLSIMKEDSPSLLEVSGIAALERDSHSTPQGGASLETSRKLIDSSSMPIINITPEADDRINKVLNELNSEIANESSETQPKPTQQRLSWTQTEILCKSTEFTEQKSETPKTNAKPVGRTNSLEKIINRFKKMRNSYLPVDTKQDYASDIRPILEEKENVNTVNVDVSTVNRILLPDLLSPSCSLISQKSNDNTEQWDFKDEEKPWKTRESLGTALGVDHTFLDQFDLVE